MPYVVPNEADAGFSDQAELDSKDLEILSAGLSYGTSGSNYGIGPTGVQSGCAVTAQGSPDMTVAVAAGVVRIGGRKVTVTGGNVTITTANGTNPRFDLIVVDTAGAKTAIAGTAAANAVFPTITAGRVVLAAVYVPANDTAINANQITDKRVMVDPPMMENVRWYGAKGDDSTNDHDAIQAAIDSFPTTGFSRGGTVFFPPGIYRTNTAITLVQGVHLTAAGRAAEDAQYGAWISAGANSINLLNFPTPGGVAQIGFKISNLGLVCFSSFSGVTGLRVSGVNRWRVEDCTFLSGTSAGEMAHGIYATVDAMDMAWMNIRGCEFRNVMTGIRTLGGGMNVSGSNFVNAGAMVGDRNMWFEATTTESAQGSFITACDFDPGNSTTSYGIYMQGGMNTIANCAFEGAGSVVNTGVYFEKVPGSPTPSGTRNTLVNCLFSSLGTAVNISSSTVEDVMILGALYNGGNNVDLIDNGTDTTLIDRPGAAVPRPAQFPRGIRMTAHAIPATPPTNMVSLFVDNADAVLKSKDWNGVLSVYGARTRSLFIDGSILRIDASTGVRLGTPPNAVDGVQLADGITSGAYCNFIMPVDAFTGTIVVRPIWVPGATDGTAHTVRWRMTIRVISAADVTAAGTQVAWTGVSAARTVNVEVMETGQASTGVSPVANDRVRLGLQRVGGDGADTYVGAVNLIGIRLDFAANN